MTLRVRGRVTGRAGGRERRRAGVRPLAALAAALTLLAGCGFPIGGVQAPSRGAADVCLPMFLEFDRLEQWNSLPRADSDLVEVPALQRQGQRLLRAGCITWSRNLDLTAAAPPVAEGGRAIRPLAIHAGVVTGFADEFRVRAFFGDQGVRVRSVGDASLGRRIYLGPYGTEEGLRSAAAAARAAGFVAPYPARF